MIKSDRLYLNDIVEAIQRIEEYTKDLTKKQFLSNYLVQDAVIRNLEIIGEAAARIKRISPAVYKDLKLEQAKGMRNVLAHDYHQVDLLIVWQTIRTDIPKLKQSIITKLKGNKENQPTSN